MRNPTTDPHAYARNTDPATSHAAAEKVRVNPCERAVLATLTLYGPLTSHEIATRSGLSLVTVSPRMKRLEERALVAREGKRDGRTVWRATTP